MRKPSEVREWISAQVLLWDGSEITRGAKGALIHALERAVGGAHNRHLVFEYLFGKESSKELTGGEWFAIRNWVGAVDVMGKWIPRSQFRIEAVSCLYVQKYGETYHFD